LPRHGPPQLGLAMYDAYRGFGHYGMGREAWAQQQPILAARAGSFPRPR